MEDCSPLSQKIAASLTHFKAKSQKLDQVSAHCRQDHFTAVNLD